MSSGLPERLDPASRVLETQAQQPWRDDDVRKHRPKKPAPKKSESNETLDGSPSHQFDDLA